MYLVSIGIMYRCEAVAYSGSNQHFAGDSRVQQADAVLDAGITQRIVLGCYNK